MLSRVTRPELCILKWNLINFCKNNPIVTSQIKSWQQQRKGIYTQSEHLRNHKNSSINTVVAVTNCKIILKPLIVFIYKFSINYIMLVFVRVYFKRCLLFLPADYWLNLFSGLLTTHTLLKLDRSWEQYY